MKHKGNSDKLIKISTVISVLLIGIAVFYYLVIFLPAKTKEEESNRNLENRLKTTKQLDDLNKANQKKSEEETKQETISKCTTEYTNYPFTNYQKDVARDPSNATYYKKLYDDTYEQCLRTHGVSP